MTPSIPDADLVIWSAVADLKVAQRWLRSSLSVHRDVGLDQLATIIDGLDAARRQTDDPAPTLFDGEGS